MKSTAHTTICPRPFHC